MQKMEDMENCIQYWNWEYEGCGFVRFTIIDKAAGEAIGTIGRHSLLITPEFGSMVWLGCVLCDQELEPDERKALVCIVICVWRLVR